MRKPFEALRWRYLTLGASLLFILIGAIFLITFKGFKTGLDFGSGYSLRFSIDPVGLEVSYDGDGTATLSKSGDTLTLQVRSAGTIERMDYHLSDFATMDELSSRLAENGVTARVVDSSLKPSEMVSGATWPLTLGAVSQHINFAGGGIVDIEEIRAALGDDAQIQALGRGYQVRVNVGEETGQMEVEEDIIRTLDDAFGSSLVILGSDFVGPRFSITLFRSSIYAILIAIALILVYISVRFRPAYAISSVLALAHDVLSMLAFIAIFRIEVGATTIAALLTIIGYSLNNTIVIFDRIRNTLKEEHEDTRKNKKETPVFEVINDSIRRSFTRTLITTITTLVAIVPLAALSSGEIQLFAINLLWGLIVGAYSSNFIAPALLWWLNRVLPINRFKEKKPERDLLMEGY